MDDVIAAVAEGHTLRAALAQAGLLPEDWADCLRSDPGLARRALLARGRADFRAERALLAAASAGGQTGSKALEELLARRRLDLPLGESDDRSALDRLLSDPGALAGLSDADRSALDSALAALRAAEALAARLVG